MFINVISATIEVPGAPVPIVFEINPASCICGISNVIEVELLEVRTVFPLYSSRVKVVSAATVKLKSPAAGYGKFTFDEWRIVITP